MNQKVVFNGATDEQVAYGGNDDPRGVLEAGGLYEVELTDIHEWHTKIKLVGIDGWFNNTSFTYQD